MARQADLSPPLGWQGGPCKVVERIEHQVRSPVLRDDLAEKVEHGDKLSNPEAAKVYSMTSDKGGGLFKAMRISPHAQYRMDQRSITVGDLRVALMNYSRKLNDWKSQKSWQWEEFERNTMRGEPIEWNDKKLGDLRVVFRNERGTAVIISTFWVGLKDPRPETCGTHPRHAAITTQDQSGYRTFVKDPAPQKSDTGDEEKGDGKYPTQGLPSPPWSRSKPTKGPTVLNVPGESGSSSDGNIHKDKARTKGRPGGQYDGGKTHPDTPYNNTGITPSRRPGMTAEQDWDLSDVWAEWDDGRGVEAGYKPRFTSPHPPGNMREKVQKGRAKRYFAKRYMRLKGRIKRQVTRRWRRLKNNNRFQSRREKAKELPARHKRRPGGGPSTISQRSKMDRKKKQDKKASFEGIPFFHYPTDEWGTLLEVTPEGDALIEWGDGEQESTDIETFFAEAVVEEEYQDELFLYLDDLLTDDEDDSDEDEDDEEDPLFDAWFNQDAAHRLASEVIADFLREQRPPDMDPDQVYDRANDHDERSRRDRKPGTPGMNGPYEDEVHDSNPGSRVYPSGKDHVEKSAKFNYRALPRQCREALTQLIKTPLWRQYRNGRAVDREVLQFLQANGWNTLTQDGLHKMFDQIVHMKVARRAYRTAALIRDIREGCASDLVSRAQGLDFRVARVSEKNGVWLFDVQGSKDPYRVRFKAQRKGNVTDIRKAHVKVSCSCPFWQWQGPEHWAKAGGYLYGSPQGSATRPNIKDPNGQHRACKHVLAVLDHVTSNRWSVPKAQQRQARYLADSVRVGKMVADFPEFELHRRKLAARYLASLEVQ